MLVKIRILFENRPECEQLYFETFYNHRFGSKSSQALVGRMALKFFDWHRLYHLILFVKMTDLIFKMWNWLLCFIAWAWFNSREAKIFPFSYYASTLIHCSQVIKDFKNINTFHKTRTHGLGFGCKIFKRNHYTWRRNDGFHFSPKGKKWRSKRHLPLGR